MSFKPSPKRHPKLPVRIGIVAPGRRLTEATGAVVTALAQSSGLPIELVIHPQAYLEHGHFAGPDEARLQAFLDSANDPTIDAIWFARGGYGAARLVSGLLGKLSPVALNKVYLGYSDAGFLLAALTKLGCRYCAHGPLVGDIDRVDGDKTLLRAMSFMARKAGVGAGAGAEIERGLSQDGLNLAFNLTILRSLLGTQWPPEFGGLRVTLSLEDVAEYAYATDRSMFQLSQSAWFRENVHAVRIGRFSHVPDNDVPFPLTSAEVVAFWCAQADVEVLGAADIGHDADNQIVPFGRLDDWRAAGLL